MPGFRREARGCEKCGFAYLFELLDDYYPAPAAAFFACDAEERIVDCGRGSFELTGLRTESRDRPIAGGTCWRSASRTASTTSRLRRSSGRYAVTGKPVAAERRPRASERCRRHLSRLR